MAKHTLKILLCQYGKTFKVNDKLFIRMVDRGETLCLIINQSLHKTPHKILHKNSTKGWYTYDVHENCSIFKTPYPHFSIYVQNSSTPLTLDIEFQTKPPSLQMIPNQLRGNIIQEWLLHVIRSFLQVGFRFQYQLIYLVWLSFDFFSFSWSLTIYFFVALYSCVCSCPKISRNVFYL